MSQHASLLITAASPTPTPVGARPQNVADEVAAEISALCTALRSLMPSLASSADRDVPPALLIQRAAATLAAAEGGAVRLYERLREDQRELNAYRHQLDQYENKLGELHQQADRRARALQAVATLRENLRILQAHPAGVGAWVLPAVLDDLDEVLSGVATKPRSLLQMLVLDKLVAAEVANERGAELQKALVAMLENLTNERIRAVDDLATADRLLGCLLRRLQQRQDLPGMPRHQRPSHEELSLLEAGVIRATRVHLDRDKGAPNQAAPGKTGGGGGLWRGIDLAAPGGRTTYKV